MPQPRHGRDYVQQLLCEDPTLSVAQLHERARAHGFDVALNTVSAAVTNFKLTAQALQEADLMRRRLYPNKGG